MSKAELIIKELYKENLKNYSLLYIRDPENRIDFKLEKEDGLIYETGVTDSDLVSIKYIIKSIPKYFNYDKRYLMLNASNSKMINDLITSELVEYCTENNIKLIIV